MKLATDFCAVVLLSTFVQSVWGQDDPNPPYTLYDLPIHTPFDCRQGYVWREANQRDDVCVTPETRSKTAEENALAPSRRSLNGGRYGVDTCREKFVWREAFKDDHACVPPERREQAREDNRHARERQRGTTNN
jgi:hypothetical protein